MIEFVQGAAHVQAPATSANLGSGFDTLGLALSLHDDVRASIGVEGLVLEVRGEGVDLARDETHLLVRAMRAAFHRLGGQPPGLVIDCTNRIPHGRGLGSSAAAIVAGVQLARALVVDGRAQLPDDAAFALAAELEGHPDNVAACLFGGLTICVGPPDGEVRAVRCAVRADVRPVALIPPYASSTAAVRGLLPPTVPYADAPFAAARTALLVAQLTSADVDPELLLLATDDRLHQPYRAAAMPESAALVAALRGDGHAAFVSGAGPTVLALARDQVEVQKISATVPRGWRAEPMAVDSEGARVITSAGDAQSAHAAPAAE